MGRDPLVGRERNFNGSRKSFKIWINACFLSNNLNENYHLNYMFFFTVLFSKYFEVHVELCGTPKFMF